MRKIWFGKCLKMLVSEALSTSNMLNGVRHCLNLYNSTFNILIDQYEWNLVGKSLSWWYVKSSDCLLTHWLPIARILFLIGTIWGNQFRCNYLKKSFSNWFSSLLKSRLNFEHYEKKMTFIGYVFPKLRTAKNVVR